VRDYADQQGFTVLFLNYGYRDNAVRYDKTTSFNSIFDYYVDLRNEFEGMREMPVWYDAIHPNPAGHKFIAERLYRYIETNKLLQAN
jgi:lysophospholipase L1-like esterase